MLVLGLGWLLLAGCANELANNPRCASNDPLTSFEAELIAEINALRRDPPAYAEHVRQQFATLDSSGVYTMGKVRVRSREGRPAVDEAIRALRAAPSLRTMGHSACLAAGARDHARDRGANGAFGHIGMDGSLPPARVERYSGGKASCGEVISYGHTTARNVLVGLVVDDGVPSRGHRKALLDPTYSLIGSALDQHRQAGSIAVLVLCTS